MEVISGCREFRKPLAYLPGLLLLSLGIYVIIDQPQITYIRSQIQQATELREGNSAYRIWKNSTILFKIWIFDITNPRQVADGAYPVLKEVGPFVYDLNIEKDVISIDEDLDEIKYMVTKTYHFNKKESGNLTEDFEVTVVSFAYVGVIRMIANMFPSFLPRIGPSLHTLFKKTNGIFMRAKAGDVLFRGLQLSCVDADKSLNLICNFLKGKPPALLKKVEDGIFLYSVLDRANGTPQGPFTINRGIKNQDSLGNITSYKGMKITNYWTSDDCNAVRGTDSVTWGPIPQDRDHEFWVFEPEICRSIHIKHTKNEIITTLLGNYVEMDHSSWDSESMDCPCDPNNKKVECLPLGLIDLTKCQEVPVIFSEPHFLNAPADLLDYAQGLEPNKSKHGTFMIIEPLTGRPLAGSKKLQLNVKVINTPSIPILANVSTGIFPILWAEGASVATLQQASPIINVHRLFNVSKFLGWQLLLIGIWLIMKNLLINNQPYYWITHPRYPRRNAFE